MKSNLHALSQLNDLFKYADDTTLLVSKHTDISISSEFDHVRTWAARNCLTLNLIKTKELVFRRSRAPVSFHMPPALDNTEQVTCCKLLGVLFQSNFKMDSHVQYILTQCCQRLYLLKMLKHQGVTKRQLAVVTQLIIISRMLYALPAWSGFLSTEMINRINAFLKRLKRFDYIGCSVTIDDLISKSDYELFIKMCLPGHSLYHLLPPSRISKLRQRGHSFSLPEYTTDLDKNQFLYDHSTNLSNFKTLDYIFYNIIAYMVATILLLCFCVLCFMFHVIMFYVIMCLY